MNFEERTPKYFKIKKLIQVDHQKHTVNRRTFKTKRDLRGIEKRVLFDSVKQIVKRMELFLKTQKYGR